MGCDKIPFKGRHGDITGAATGTIFFAGDVQLGDKLVINSVNLI
jgi:hypothetical protein